MTGSTFDSNGEYGLRIDPRVTSLQVANSNIINNAIDGLLLLNANGATLQDLTITGNRNGILLIPLTNSQSISNLTLTNVNASNNTKFISGHFGSGITFTGDTGSISQITITGSTFSGNGIHGVDTTGAVSQVSIDCSVIGTNVQQGIHEASSPSAQLTAKHVYWGCATGPNTAGCSTVSGNVAFLPFRTSATATCSPSVDLGVTKTASPNPVAAGGSLTYTITATNNGPDPATGVVLTDTLPATVTFVSASSGCALSGANVTCSIGNLASGGQASRTIAVTAPASSGSVTNSVLIAGNETPDPNTANNTATVTTTVQSAVTLTSITVTPSSASLLSGPTVQLTATALYSDNSTQNVTAQAAWKTSANAIVSVSSSGLATAAGQGTATITATFNSKSATSTIDVAPPPPSLTGITITSITTTPTAGTVEQLTVRGLYSDGSNSDVTSSAIWTSSNAAVATVSTTGLLSAIAGGSATITATVASFTASAVISVLTPGGPPPDPAAVAPPLDSHTPTGVLDATQFLYTTSGIQTGMSAGTITRQRAAVIRGIVRTRDNQALPNVAVSVLGQPQFGQTRTRTDGAFDLVVNGGSGLTIRFQKDGFIPADRIVVVPWNDYSFADDLVMIPYDSSVTAVDLSSSTTTVARGSLSTDADGSRQATMFFSPQTTATMILPDRSTQILTTLHVRATEYTLGANGPASMPAPLPPASGYTYCLELSADEAIAASATNLSFSQPVSLYIENFLNFPVGQAVPLGSYDRSLARWVAAPNGRVVQVVSVVDGRAYLDVDGDGSADDSDALIGTTPEERQQLGTVYHAGQSLWRVSVSHFTPWDCNWPYGPPNGASEPANAAPSSDDRTDSPNCRQGSIIECENQTLGETVAISGTPFSLNYRSDRVPGRKPDYAVKIPLSGATLPPGLIRIDLEIAVAGQRVTRSFPPSPNLTYTFVWNGLDAYNRIVTSEQPATIRIGNVYTPVYRTPRELVQAFAAYGDNEITGNRVRGEITLWQEWKTAIGTWDGGASQLGGWTLSVVHAYDPYRKALYQGDGRRRSAAGGGALDVVQSVDGQLSGANSVAADAAGNLYSNDGGGANIFRIAPDGTVSTIAGTGEIAFGGDGGPATAAQVGIPRYFAVAPDGSLYFLDFFTRIRRIAPDGTIATIVGNGTFDDTAVGIAATDASLQNVHDVAVGPLGELYFGRGNSGGDGSDHGGIFRVGTDGRLQLVAGLAANQLIEADAQHGDGRRAIGVDIGGVQSLAIDQYGNVFFTDGFVVWKVTPDGILHHVAGTMEHIGPPPYFAGDGGPATLATVDGTGPMTVTPDGTLYFSDQENHCIRRVTTDGIITTVAGRGSSIDNGAPALSTTFASVAGASPDGALLTFGPSHLCRMGPALPGTVAGQLTVASADGGELFIFSETGRHIRTVDAHMGTNLFQFSYSPAGLLTGITDVDGRVTRIERDGAGTPTAIIAPDGQRTSLVQTGSYLTQISNPAGDSFVVGYSSDGLLTSMRDPRGNSSQMSYDGNGLLVHDGNAAGGFTDLTRTDGPDGTYVVTETTAMNRTRRYEVANLPTGERRMTTTAADGTQTVSHAALDGSKTITQPDGTVISGTTTSDPRWGMDSPVMQGTITTPSHRTLNITEGRTAVLSDPKDPLTLTSETRTIQVNNRVFTSVFDRLSRTVTSTSPLGRQTSTSLDGTGRVTRVQSGDSAALQYGYDSRGLLTTFSAGSRLTAFTYDTSGQLASITDHLARVTRFAYDTAGRVVQQTMPDQREIFFSYDANGNLTGLTPPSRPRHAFTYGLINEVQSYAPPLTASTQYTYNLDGQLTAVIQSDGTRVDIGYDASGRESSVTHADGQLSFAYDGVNGTLRSVSGPAGGISYSYDGPLLTGTSWFGTVSGQVGFGYDNDFRITAESVNGGNSVTYAYDGDGLIASAGALTISRDAQTGRITATQIGAVSDSYLYNSFGEVTSYTASVNGAPVLALSYTRDPVGRISTATEASQGATVTRGYGYDDGARLTTTTQDGVTHATYTYDANSNRLSVADTSGTKAATYDDEDRLLTYGAAFYTYSGRGDLQSRTDTTGTTQYKYDAFGNLLRVTLADGTVVDYVIDSQNRRIGKKVNGSLIQGFLYSDQLRVAAELDSAGGVRSRFVYATSAAAPTYMIKGGLNYRIVSDHLGSPRLVIDVASGAVVQRMDYDEFGNVLADTNPGFQPFGFAGGLYDVDTKFARFGARDYDLQIGRWTTGDPIGFAGKQSNLYSYGFGDPVNYADQSGTLTLPFVGWVDLGENAGTAALTGYADTLADPNAGVLAKGAAVVGGFFAALWTPCTSDKTFATLAGAYAADQYVGRSFWQYTNGSPEYSSRYLTRGWGWQPPYEPGMEAAERLALPSYNPGITVNEVPNSFRFFAGGPGEVPPAFGHGGGGTQYLVGGWP